MYNLVGMKIVNVNYENNFKEKYMKIFLVASLLCISACADKGYEALPNHNHIECLGSCDVKIK